MAANAISLLGMGEMSDQELRARVEKGLEYERLTRFQENADLSQQKISELIQVPLTTLTRRRRKGRLEPAESDRLVRAARIMGQAIELFEGDASSARRWLETPNPSLDGEAPLEVSKTEIGGRMVEELILQLEHGVYG
jgi:putative toxin-antitoxin system antitoxin component (TIGR02293 family)